MLKYLVNLKDASGRLLWLTFAIIAATCGPIGNSTLLLGIHDFLLQRRLVVSIVLFTLTTTTTDELS